MLKQYQKDLLLNLMLDWFSNHNEARHDVKDYLLTAFTKKELNEIFDDVNVEAKDEDDGL